MTTYSTTHPGLLARLWRKWYLRFRISACESDIEVMRSYVDGLPAVIAAHERECEEWRVELAILERAK